MRIRSYALAVCAAFALCLVIVPATMAAPSDAGVFVKNLTYDTKFQHEDGSGKPRPITMPDDRRRRASGDLA